MDTFQQYNMALIKLPEDLKSELEIIRPIFEKAKSGDISGADSIAGTHI
jgi:hypothetical protein